MNTISVVVGATGTIGSEIVRQLLKRGDLVIAISRSQANLKRKFSRHLQTGLMILVPLDAMMPIGNNWAPFFAKYERVNNLFICTGEHFTGNFFNSDLDTYLSNFDLNFTFVVRALKSFQGLLSTQSNVVILNSMASKTPNPNEGPYGLAKAGLTKFIESISYEARQRKICILNIIFGAVRSRMTEKRPDYAKLISPQELVSVILQNTAFYKSLQVRSLEIERRTL